MRLPWRCERCLHANPSHNDECYWCGSTERVLLHPVRVTNQLQGTPSQEDLIRQLNVDEFNRQTDKSFAELKAERIAQFIKEKNNGQTNHESS